MCGEGLYTCLEKNQAIESDAAVGSAVPAPGPCASGIANKARRGKRGSWQRSQKVPRGPLQLKQTVLELGEKCCLGQLRSRTRMVPR